MENSTLLKQVVSPASVSQVCNCPLKPFGETPNSFELTCDLRIQDMRRQSGKSISFYFGVSRCGAIILE